MPHDDDTSSVTGSGNWIVFFTRLTITNPPKSNLPRAGQPASIFQIVQCNVSLDKSLFNTFRFSLFFALTKGAFRIHGGIWGSDTNI